MVITKCKLTILLIVFGISMVMQSCTEKKSYDRHKEKVYGAYVFTDLDYALKSAEKQDKELIVFFDSPSVGSCCRTSRDMIFSAFQKSKYTDRFELVYLPVDDRTKIISDKLLPEYDGYHKVETVGALNTTTLLDLKGFATTTYLIRMDAEQNFLKECSYLKDRKELASFLAF